MSRFKYRIAALAFLIGSLSIEGFSSAQAQEDFRETLNEQIQAVTEMDLKTLIAELDETWALYEKQLQSVLRTRLVEEKEFLARVILLAQQEHVPKNLLDSAWLWVRDKRPGTSYPFVYFERVLRLEADKAKIALPTFNRDVYNNREAMRQRRLQERFRR